MRTSWLNENISYVHKFNEEYTAGDEATQGLKTTSNYTIILIVVSFCAACVLIYEHDDFWSYRWAKRRRRGTITGRQMPDDTSVAAGGAGGGGGGRRVASCLHAVRKHTVEGGTVYINWLQDSITAAWSGHGDKLTVESVRGRWLLCSQQRRERERENE